MAVKDAKDVQPAPGQRAGRYRVLRGGRGGAWEHGWVELRRACWEHQFGDCEMKERKAGPILGMIQRCGARAPQETVNRIMSDCTLQKLINVGHQYGDGLLAAT